MSDVTFFRGRRLSVYCKGGRLFKDKKTDVRYWRLKFALTLHPADAHACGDSSAILSNYQHIEARQNAVGRLEIDGGSPAMVLTAFASSDPASPQLIRLDKCFIEKFAMTWADGMTVFWLQLEHENTEALHRFVKDYAFSRFYVEFLPVQRSLAEVIAENAAKPDNPLQQMTDAGGPSWELTDNKGQVLAKSKPKGRVN